MKALENPRSQGPQDIGNPVPGEDQFAQEDRAVDAALLDMPELNDLPAQEAPRGPASFPAQVANSNPFSDLIPGGGSAQAAEPQAAPQAQAQNNPFHDLIPAGKTEAPAEVQGPPEPISKVPGLTQNFGLVKMPSGEFGVLSEDGHVRHLSPMEKSAAKYVAHGLRIGGSTVGAILGELVGLPTGVGALAGPMIGGAGGAAAVHPVAATLEEIAGEKPKELGTEAALGAGGALVGGVVGKVASKFGGSFLPGIAKTEAKGLAEAGSNVISREANEAVQASEAAKIPLTEKEINPNLEATKAEKAKVGRDQEIVDQFDALKNKIGPEVTPEKSMEFSAKTEVDKVRQGHEAAIHELKNKAYQLSGNAKDPNLADEILKVVEKNYEDRLAEPSKNVQKLLDRIEENNGATHKELDQLMTRIGDEANFHGSGSYSPDEQAAKKTYGELVEIRDKALQKTFESSGDKESLSRLQTERKAYSSKREILVDFQNKLSEDPDMFGAAKLVAKKNNPKTIKSFLELMPEEKQLEFRRIMADDIIGDVTRKNLGTGKLEEKLNQYTPSVLKEIFGDTLPEFYKLANVAKRVEASPKPGKATLTTLMDLAHSKTSFIKNAANAIIKTAGGKVPKGAPTAGAAGASTLGELLNTEERKR